MFTLLCGTACSTIPQSSTNGSSTQTPSASVGAGNGDGSQLQFMKSDSYFTQEQQLSRIKADKLMQNGGYLDTDEVVVMVTLKEDALIDGYLNGNTAAKSVAEYAKTTAGLADLREISAEQSAFIRLLQSGNLIKNVRYNYSTVANAVAVTIEYGNLEKIQSLAGVQSVALSDTYNLPQTTSGGSDASAIENVVDVYETGIFNSSSVSYTGKGTAVAVLDSGFDCSHTVFANQPATDDLLLTRSTVASKLPESVAMRHTSDLDISDVYYSNKIPFMYDYAEKDPDVFPFDSSHGTHVAGIIGGKDDVITGVAVDTQLVMMKVFPDSGDGAKSEDILAAVEDSVLLGVDAINMSLGTSCGFAREEDGNVINAVYDKVEESGISLLVAASNSYSSAQGGEQGNTNFVTNPDSATVGSPSTYAAAVSVASISGTKSSYLKTEDGEVIFFHESNYIDGKQKDFMKELSEAIGLDENEERAVEYVTVPGSGLSDSFANLDLTGKIALIRRGTNTFEENARLAKQRGAIAAIIYNNIDGDILMSMGKRDDQGDPSQRKIPPSISISKDDGTLLASKRTGTIIVSNTFKAGPFISDFSSWGPTPSLGLKPEITAHGGNIKSAVPGGGYDEQSGTSMATPNLCGVVVLIRQFLKEKYPDKSWKEISNLTNSLLMSTATIVLNQDGNPYSPRQQGSGLASLKNVVNTSAYLSIPGKDRPTFELKDDPSRTGVYKMKFNVENMTDKALTYDLSVVGMSESVSTYEPDHVAQRSYLLNGLTEFTVTSGGTKNGNTITVNANASASVELTYQLTDADKKYIEEHFPYGMYVEGFLKLTAKGESNAVSLNAPFLAFYGDWTEAPLFDKTFYEVETEAHNDAIDDEDKLKADYYATTPYGSYYYNYVIPLGSYLYELDTSVYPAIPAVEEHIAVSDQLGTIDGFSTVYAGMLRNGVDMTFTITDKVTGEVIAEHIDYRTPKAHSNGATPIPYYEYLKWYSSDMGFMNNRQYEFKMQAKLDYGDGGLKTNVRNSFTFDFTFDNEAPVLKNIEYEKKYDRTLKKDRHYVTLTIYDNHYIQSVTPIVFNKEDEYAFLESDPIPVYGEKGKDNKIRIEVTEQLENLYADPITSHCLAFAIDDYALNGNIFFCELPGTHGPFRFTENGEYDGTRKTMLSVKTGEIHDLTQFLASADATLDEDKDFLKYLSWTSSNENVLQVNEGVIRAIAPGVATIKVSEKVNVLGHSSANDASIVVTVTGAAATATSLSSSVGSYDDAAIQEIRFAYFDTVYAHPLAGMSTDIGETGDRIYISARPSVEFYPGEKIKLSPDIEPWYVADKYTLTYETTNPDVVKVEQDGTVTALKEGSATVTLKVSGSNLLARLRLTVNSEFVIENRMLMAYKGIGGKVVIPDDEGIVYISAYAFGLYEVDRDIVVDEDDYDRNKIPQYNHTITEIVVPDGVEEIQKYAFYNCTALEKVTLPDSVKYIQKYCFYGNESLKEIDLKKTQALGDYAFYGCTSLENIDLSGVFAMGESAFEGCTKLASANLTMLRNNGKNTFKNCGALKSVTLTPNTKLSVGMFENAGLESVELFEKVAIPKNCFKNCDDLTTVKLNSNGEVFLNEDAFFGCDKLTKLVLGKDVRVLNGVGTFFRESKLSTFEVDAENTQYTVSADGALLLNADGTSVVLAAPAFAFGEYTLPETVTKIENGAFGGTSITQLTVPNANLTIGAYAFANCESLTAIVLPAQAGLTVGAHAFDGAKALAEITNLNALTKIGDYAFANCGITEVAIAEGTGVGEGAFASSALKIVTLGKNVTLGKSAFEGCAELTTVNMPEEGGVAIGERSFAYCSTLETIDFSKADPVIGGWAFYRCIALTEANLPQVTEIGTYAFANCSALATVNMPVVERLGDGAFARYMESGTDDTAGAPIFKQITLPETLTHVGEGVFLNCEELTSVVLPDSVQTIGAYAFALCYALESVQLPQSITVLPEHIFWQCSELTAVNTANITQFGDYAFASATKLTDVDISAASEIGEAAFAETDVTGSFTAPNLTKVGESAFVGANLTSLQADKLAYIGMRAFEANEEIVKFVLSKDISFVGAGAFNSCKNLRSFYYVGADGNQTSSGKINGYALLDGGALYVTMASGNYQLSCIPANLKVQEFVVYEGTQSVERFAGSANKHIRSLVLPDSLRSIGNFAFYGFSSLSSVEFRSVSAPTLESYYVEGVSLPTDAPGYELLHGFFDVFVYELCYFNFINLVGAFEPIQMILPSNADVTGYDSIIYEAYFGKVDGAKRSDYVAQEQNMINFYTYAKKIDSLNVITLTAETLVNRALSAYNAMTQNPADFGYDMEEWKLLVQTVNEARSTILDIKLANASQAVKDVQAMIDALTPIDAFTVDMLAEMQALTKKITALSVENRAILRTDKYDERVALYNAYLADLKKDTDQVKQIVNVNSYDVVAAVAATLSLAGAAWFVGKRIGL